jgi:hypothetical protein
MTDVPNHFDGRRPLSPAMILREPCQKAGQYQNSAHCTGCPVKDLCDARSAGWWQ